LIDSVYDITCDDAVSLRLRSFLRARGLGDVIGHDLPSLCDLVKITAEEMLEK